MSNENSSIHEFDFRLICKYFSSLERQGPGSPEVTIKALSFIDNLTDDSRIAIIDCDNPKKRQQVVEDYDEHYRHQSLEQWKPGY